MLTDMLGYLQMIGDYIITLFTGLGKMLQYIGEVGLNMPGVFNALPSYMIGIVYAVMSVSVLYVILGVVL